MDLELSRDQEFFRETTRKFLEAESPLTTVRQLAELIWRKVKGEALPLRLVHDEPFQYDVQRRVPDTEKAKKVLGFEATTTLDQMLDEVIPWIDAAVKAGTI